MKKLLIGLLAFGSFSAFAENSCPFGRIVDLFSYTSFGNSAVVKLAPNYTPGTINLVQYAVIGKDSKAAGRYTMLEVIPKDFGADCSAEETVTIQSGQEFCKSNSKLLPNEFFLVRVKNDCWIGYPSYEKGSIELSQRILDAKRGDAGNVLFTSLSLSSASSSDDSKIAGTWTTVGVVQK